MSSTCSCTSSSRLREPRRPARCGDGPLAGVPFLLKDLGQSQAGVPERMGSRALRDHVPSETAWTVERYLAAGLIICGRTNTAEFGNHCATEPALFGRTLNPWRPELSPGGSSGGSAAAVAAGLIGAASGSDGTGSIRMPAACCGLVGLKPRRARSSVRAFGRRRARRPQHTHALTRSVRDTALLLDVIAGSAPGDPFPAPPPARPFVQEVGADPGRLRVMHLERPPFPGRPTRASRTWPTARPSAQELGHHVVPGALQFDPEVMRHAISVIHAVDNAATFSWLLQELGRRAGARRARTGDLGHAARGTRAGRASTTSRRSTICTPRRGEPRAHSSPADLLLCPTLNVLPPPPGIAVGRRGAAWMRSSTSSSPRPARPRWPMPPVGRRSRCHSARSTGLPVGVQMMAPEEAVLLRVAAQLELAMPWSDRRPTAYA